MCHKLGNAAVSSNMPSRNIWVYASLQTTGKCTKSQSDHTVEGFCVCASLSVAQMLLFLQECTSTESVLACWLWPMKQHSRWVDSAHWEGPLCTPPCRFFLALASSQKGHRRWSLCPGPLQPLTAHVRRNIKHTAGPFEATNTLAAARFSCRWQPPSS